MDMNGCRLQLLFEVNHKDIWACKIATVPSGDSDQTAHLRSLIRVFAVCLTTFWLLGYPNSVLQRLWSDCADAQAGQSLLWALIMQSCCLGNALSRPICFVLLYCPDYQLQRRNIFRSNTQFCQPGLSMLFCGDIILIHDENKQIFPVQKLYFEN